jgi:thioesterase component of yersiniabactin synthetase
MSLFLPLLRADFYATETITTTRPMFPPCARLRCSCGSRDREASWPEMEAWRPWLNHVAGEVVIDGDHFYLLQQSRAFLRRLFTIFPTYFLRRPLCKIGPAFQKGDACTLL